MPALVVASGTAHNSMSGGHVTVLRALPHVRTSHAIPWYVRRSSKGQESYMLCHFGEHFTSRRK